MENQELEKIKNSPEFIELLNQSNLVLNECKGLVIDTRENAELAAGKSKTIRAVEKAVEELRKEKLKPLKQQVIEINEIIAELATPLNDAKNNLKIKLTEFTRLEDLAEAKIQAAAAKKRAAELLKNKPLAPVKEYVPPPPPKPKLMKTKKVWKIEVLDFSQVDDKFKQFVEQRVRAEISTGVTSQKGLKIWQEEVKTW